MTFLLAWPNTLYLKIEVFSLIVNLFRKTRTTLQTDQSYWWRVRAFNVAGYGPFSDARRFSLVVTDVTSDDPNIPTEFYLHHNYPNPFTPLDSLHYLLLED